MKSVLLKKYLKIKKETVKRKEFLLNALEQLSKYHNKYIDLLPDNDQQIIQNIFDKYIVTWKDTENTVNKYESVFWIKYKKSNERILSLSSARQYIDDIEHTLLTLNHFIANIDEIEKLQLLKRRQNVIKRKFPKNSFKTANRLNLL